MKLYIDALSTIITWLPQVGRSTAFGWMRSTPSRMEIRPINIMADQFTSVKTNHLEFGYLSNYQKCHFCLVSLADGPLSYDNFHTAKQ
jgi:hypothetical protein